MNNETLHTSRRSLAAQAFRNLSLVLGGAWAVTIFVSFSAAGEPGSIDGMTLVFIALGLAAAGAIAEVFHAIFDDERGAHNLVAIALHGIPWALAIAGWIFLLCTFPNC